MVSSFVAICCYLRCVLWTSRLLTYHRRATLVQRSTQHLNDQDTFTTSTSRHVGPSVHCGSVALAAQCSVNQQQRMAMKTMRSCDMQDAEELFSSSDAIATPSLYNTSAILLVLKVAPDSDTSKIIATHVKFLVRLPFVAAYMDRFVNADASQWADLLERFRHFRRNPMEDRDGFDALMRAHARLCSRDQSDNKTVSTDLKLLGLTRYSGQAAAAQALKTQLLLIPRCDVSIVLVSW